MTTFSVEIAATTHTGMVRTSHEDAVHVAGWTAAATGATLHQHLSGPCVLAVIDGMGGHPGGATAARVASAALGDLKLAEATTVDEVNDIVQRVSDTVQEIGAMTEGYTIMGATVAGLVLRGEETLLFNAGDCSILRLAGDTMEQLATIDREHGMWGSLSQGLGGRPKAQAINPHGKRFEPTDGDLLILCSDGLTDSTDNAAIAALAHNHSDLPTLAQELVKAANNAGGSDNISLIAARFTTAED